MAAGLRTIGRNRPPTLNLKIRPERDTLSHPIVANAGAVTNTRFIPSTLVNIARFQRLD